MTFEITSLRSLHFSDQYHKILIQYQTIKILKTSYLKISIYEMRSTFIMNKNIMKTVDKIQSLKLIYWTHFKSELLIKRFWTASSPEMWMQHCIQLNSMMNDSMAYHYWQLWFWQRFPFHQTFGECMKCSESRQSESRPVHHSLWVCDLDRGHFYLILSVGHCKK